MIRDIVDADVLRLLSYFLADDVEAGGGVVVSEHGQLDWENNVTLVGRCVWLFVDVFEVAAALAGEFDREHVLLAHHHQQLPHYYIERPPLLLHFVAAAAYGTLMS